jgi:hypothetical protein
MKKYRFDICYESIKRDILMDAPKLQTEFNRELSNGWNLFLMNDKKDNNDIPFVLMADNKKFEGKITIIDEEFEISWESEKPLENEGLVFGEELNAALKNMVDNINFND